MPSNVSHSPLLARPPPKGKGKGSSKKTPSTDKASLESAMQALSVKPTASVSKVSSAPSEPPAPSSSSAARSQSIPSSTVILESQAELFLWDRPSQFFIRQSDVSAKLQKRNDSSFEYWLSASDSEGDLLVHRLTSDMNQRWSSTMWSLTWNFMSHSGTQSSWCLRFRSQEGYDQFQLAFMKGIWESLHQTSWEKVKV